MEDKIIIGTTNNKAIVSICNNCDAYSIPHFNYSKGEKHYSVEFERAIPLDHGNLMELNERTDLEKFFALYNEDYKITNWKLAVKTWNENNQMQIPNNLHKPYYRNMIEELDNYVISTTNNRNSLLDGMQIYCDEEVEAEPHFHIKFKDGIDVAVYFDRAEYLYPLYRKLTDAEIDVLIKHLNSRCNIDYFKDYTNWQYLIFAWNNQNANVQGYIYPSKKELDESMAMPDYTKLDKEQ